MTSYSEHEKMEQIMNVPGDSDFLLWVAKTQRKKQSRKDATYKKEPSRKVLDPRALHLDPLEIKIVPSKRGALPRRNLSHHLQSTCNSKQFDEERFLPYCFLLFLIPTKRAYHPKGYERLEYHHQIYFLISWLSCSRVSSSLTDSKDLFPFVTSSYSASTLQAWGYFFLMSSNLATISSLESWSMV